MKKVLFIVYYFPPDGGPAVQRILKFIKYLPRYGYQPFVLTSKHRVKTRDHTLLKELASDVTVVKTLDAGAYLPGELKKGLRKFLLPDKQALWEKTAFKKGLKLVKQAGIDLIFSSSPPHSGQLLSRRIAEATGIPLVLDFRDEWTSDPTFKHDHPGADHIKHLEKQVLESADAITTVTERATENFAGRSGSENVHFIPNGFDPEDFSEIKPRTSKKTKTLVMTYCGRFTPKSSPAAFFTALDELSRDGFDSLEHLELNVIGNPGNRKWMDETPGLYGITKFQPYLPHRECLQAMQNADVLLLLASNTKESEVFTGKLFEYMYLKKPVFASITYPGELADLLTQYGNAYIAIESQWEEYKHTLKSMFDDWKNKRLETRTADETTVRRFDRTLQTKALAALFGSVLDSKRVKR